MRPAFSGHPVDDTLLFLALVAWTVMEARQGLRRRTDATSGDRGSLNVLRLVAIAGALLAVSALRVRATAYDYNEVVFGFGFTLICAGIALRWWCFRTLGRYFTFTVMTSADQRVVTTGPYRILRHPSYLGILLILAGLGLLYGNWLSLAALVIAPLAGFVYRIRVEEAALAGALGSAYTSYASSRKRLIPYVW